MPTTDPDTGRTFHLGFKRGPSRPEKWLYELKPQAVDRTKVRSLRQFYQQPPFDQGNEGSCTANSGCLVAQACAAIDGQTVPTPFSRDWMYFYEREILGTFPDDSGADVIDEFQVDSQYGNVADAVWPYDANPATNPPAAAIKAPTYKTCAAYQPIAAGSQSTIDGILTALDNKQPVAIGLAWADAFTTAYGNGTVVTPAMYKNMGEGHALTIVGWAPPSTAYPNGVFVLQGSWGQASPAKTAIWADARAGDHYFDASLIADGNIVTDIYAAVPLASPAVITVTVTAPASAQVGVASAWIALVVGVPAGSFVSYAWSFSDGGTATGVGVSYTPKTAGTLTGTCTASVATTGAKASGQASVSVAPAVGPTPPSGVEATIEAGIADTEKQLTGYETTDPADKAYFAYALTVVQYVDEYDVQPAFTSTTRRRRPAVPKPHK